MRDRTADLLNAIQLQKIFFPQIPENNPQFQAIIKQ
jgi:hypothetical protein